MKCPYCHGEMVKGRIIGDRNQLKWLPNDEKLILGIWAKNPIRLGGSRGFGRPEFNSYICRKCNILLGNIYPDN